VGFKRSFATFGDVYTNDPASNPKTLVGSGVMTSSVSRDTTAGAVKTTGRVTDMAIDGRGYFIVRDPSAKGDTFAFTRAGNFGVDGQGFVVDASGNKLIGFSPVNSGTLDANGKTVMNPNTTAAKIAVQVVPQFANGDILPDGSIAGQEVQQISLDGPATANGTVMIGGVAVSISKGDSIAAQADKIKSAFLSDPAFVNRTVTLIGNGDHTKIQVAFSPSEGAVGLLSLETSTAASPSVSATSQYQVDMAIQTLNTARHKSLIQGTTYTISVPILGQATSLTVNASVPQQPNNDYWDFVTSINNELQNQANIRNIPLSDIPFCSVHGPYTDYDGLNFGYADGSAFSGTVSINGGTTPDTVFSSATKQKKFLFRQQLLI
jgi:flagellar hook-basal body protein